ncbi:hypothetical protein J2T08_005322 [Neorhizobium galegae]|uniref:hypothetical protein n=1 Tax=Neorhizobium galegae TaxID=399 RepID=UPI001EBE0E39|nr:hypothetical protein [Neorhizobium galegae]MBP2562811.1 hypothetical protein [Neorhizobium galegae]MDQ0137383.1 hypothetical protein [Neorhizobium galegae]
MGSSLLPFAAGSSESGKPVQDLILELTNRNSNPCVRLEAMIIIPLRTIAPKAMDGVKTPAV